MVYTEFDSIGEFFFMHRYFLKFSNAMLPFALCLTCSAQGIQQLSHNSDVSLAMNVAQLQRDAIQLQGQEYILPQIVIGGEWTSTIKFSNRGTRQITSIPVYLYDNTGKPMRATFRSPDGRTITDSQFTITVPVGNLIEATFEGTADSQFGHAVVGCPATGVCETLGLYAEVTLRNRNSSRPDFESVFPIEQPAATQYLLFDGRDGVTTLLYLVNPTTTDSGVFLDIIDSTNKILRTVNLTTKARESQLLMLHSLSSETIGIQGTLVLRAQDTRATMVVTGLRITPSNSFTPIRAFVPPQ